MRQATIEIPITRRDGRQFLVLISPEDEELVAIARWHVVSIGNNLYVSSRIKNRTVYLHRFLMGLQHGDPRQIDHINRNGLDNRRENLRFATNALNRQNFSERGYSNNSSGYRGVSWNKERQRWETYCTIAGKTKRLGRFVDVHEAGAAVADYRRAHMPYACD